MIDQEDLQKIKDTTKETLEKMSFSVFNLDIDVENNDGSEANKDVIYLSINVSDPKFLIGQNGQTLLELERILKIILNKKIDKPFHLKIDINDYQKKKIEYLKTLAKDAADEVAFTKKEKTLPPMSAYERRIVHTELSAREDVDTESQGEGFNRCIIISPKF